MAALIVNHLAPEEEGILFGTVEEAETALANMIADYKKRKFVVTETDDNVDGKPWYSVVDEANKLVGIYCVDIGM